MSLESLIIHLFLPAHPRKAGRLTAHYSGLVKSLSCSIFNKRDESSDMAGLHGIELAPL